ncbi:MAG: Flp family type IVb pilin [Henriciella sp.]
MVRHFCFRCFGDDRGASAVEYGLLIGLMALALIGGITAVGGGTTDNFNEVVDSYPER